MFYAFGRLFDYLPNRTHCIVATWRPLDYKLMLIPNTVGCCRHGETQSMNPNPIALIIDADRCTRRLFRTFLEPQHYKICEADCGQAGIRETISKQPDVIILDLSLPDSDGLSLLKQLRESTRIPIVIVSEDDREETKVAALDAGANDYVVKPFSTAEFLARLRVLLRAIPGESEVPVLANGDLIVDLSSRCVSLAGSAVDLTPTEFAIIAILARHAGRLVSCQHLLRCVWGMDGDQKLHDLHVYIRTLRNKLDRNGNRDIIQTIGSEGYRLLLPADSYYRVAESNLH